MSIVVKTEHPYLAAGFNPPATFVSEMRIDLEENAVCALVFGAIIYFGNSNYPHPDEASLLEYINGNPKQNKKPCYNFIEITPFSLSRALERLTNSNLIESYVKDIAKKSGKESYKPLISNE
jgi:hypothetical protein